MTKKQNILKITPKIIKVDPNTPQPDVISKAARIIKEGGVIAFPTRYLYGLGAAAINPDAVERVYEIKKRSYQKPLLILVYAREDLSCLVRNVPPAALRIMQRFWPGEITIVLEAKDTLPVNLTAGTAKIGIRLPQHPVAVALVNAVQGPITATSANLAGKQGCSCIADLDPLITEKLDLILDAGPLQGGVGSTVIDVTTDPPVILREGAVSAKDIFDLLA